MSGVQFYYDNNSTLKKYFGFYTQGRNWNASGSADLSPVYVHALTEKGILDTLTHKTSAYAKTDGVSDGAKFFKLIIDIATGQNTQYTLYVLKGIHTQPELHFSVGFAGKIYHLNVRPLGSDDKRFSIHSMSEGGQTWDDPEWTVVRQ